MSGVEKLAISSLRGCARCGEDHLQDISFTAFRVPVREVDGEEPGKLLFTHWALCPTSGEPLLMIVIEKKREIVLDLDIRSIPEA